MKKLTKKILCMVIMLAMVFSLTVPALAAAPSTMAPERQAELKAQLRGIVAGYINGIADLGTGLISDDAIRGLIKGFINDFIDLGDLAGTVGSLLGGFLGDAVGDNLGIPGLDLGGILDTVLNNEIVSGILSSDFVAKVLDKTIDNILDSLDYSALIGVFTDVIIDQQTDKIWNNGNPQNFIGIGSLGWGAWNNNANTWNNGGIIAMLAVDFLGGLFTGDINDTFNGFDFMSILPPVDVLLSAVWDAIVDTTMEYFNDFKDQLIEQVKALVQEKIEELKDQAIAAAKGFFIAEINNIFGTKLTVDTTLADIEACVKAEIEKCTLEHSAIILAKLTAAKKIANITCNKDVAACLDRLIDCVKKLVADNLKLTVVYHDYMAPFVTAIVVTQNGVSATYPIVGPSSFSAKVNQIFGGDPLVAGKVTISVCFDFGGCLVQTRDWWNGCSDLTFDLEKGSWDYLI